MSEAYTRHLKLPPQEVEQLLAGQRRVYLALHAYDNRLAIVIAPSCDRYMLTRKATHGRITTRRILMTIVRSAPSCPSAPSQPPALARRSNR